MASILVATRAACLHTPKSTHQCTDTAQTFGVVRKGMGERSEGGVEEGEWVESILASILVATRAACLQTHQSAPPISAQVLLGQLDF